MHEDINVRNILDHTYCWHSTVWRQHQEEKLSPCSGSIEELHACNQASSVGQPVIEQAQAKELRVSQSHDEIRTG
jgi:hypothetical protein